MKILVTSTNGFVGLPLAQCLITAGHQVVVKVRSRDSLTTANPHLQLKAINDIDEITDWQG